MHKVPPGFNDLVRRRAQALGELAARYTTPIFRHEPDGSPTFEGSGLFVRLHDRHFLASAAHVFDGVGPGVQLLLEGRRGEFLAGTARLTRLEDSARRELDMLDLGIVPLSAEEVSAAGSFVDLVVPTNRLTTVKWAVRYVAIGYPEQLQTKKYHGATYEVRLMPYSAPEIHQPDYRLAGLSPEHHIALEFRKNRVAGPTGRGGAPNLRGMSGGGIWRLDPYRDEDMDTQPDLVGLLIGRSPRNKKVLFGTRTGSLLEVIRQMGI